MTKEKEKDLHVLRIDKICDNCGYRNKGEYALEQDMEIVCCGNCGNFLSLPNDMSDEDIESMRAIVKTALNK